MERVPTVYIVASQRNGTIYTGVTSDLLARIYQHRAKVIEGFTSEYGVARLVWFEVHHEMESAIVREKRIKKWLRAWKLELIEKDNPTWRDLAEDFGFEPLAPFESGSPNQSASQPSGNGARSGATNPRRADTENSSSRL